MTSRAFWVLGLLTATAAHGVAITAGPTMSPNAFQATITWWTDVASTTELHYGTAPAASALAYPNHSVFSGFVGPLHSRTLTFPPGLYYFRVRSFDGTSTVESSESTFSVSPRGATDPRGGLVLNGPANALLKLGNTLYVGGRFTEVGPRIGPGAAVDLTGGSLIADQPSIAGTVAAVVSDGAGGYYVGGNFRSVAGAPRWNLVHVSGDLGIDPSFVPILNNGTVNALARIGNTLYVGGSFTSINSVPRNYAAALDPNGNLLPWTPNPNGLVFSLAAQGSTVYLGGDFQLVRTTARSRVAAVDASTGVVSAWNANVNGRVNSIAIAGSTVFLGGTFTRVNGTIDRRAAAAFNNTDGTVTAWDAFLDNNVSTIAAVGTTIYLGGDFTTSRATPRAYLAALDDTVGNLTAWAPVINARVNAITPIGGSAYVVGEFTTVGGTSRSHAAAINLASGAASTWLLLGGSFTTVNAGLRRTSVAAVDSSTGAASDWSVELDKGVNAIVADCAANVVAIGGDFSFVGTMPQRRWPRRSSVIG